VTLHDQRRRIWNTAFTSKGKHTLVARLKNITKCSLALHLYEPRVNLLVSKLDEIIAVGIGKPVNVTTQFSWFGFDTMGDLTFSKSFNMLSDQRWHFMVTRLKTSIGLLGPFTPVPWLMRIGFAMPIFKVVREWNSMINWGADRMVERICVGHNL